MSQKKDDSQSLTKNNDGKPKEVAIRASEKPRKWDLNTIFTGILALFAVLSFAALAVQLQDARESFVKDQRPYIWLENGKSMGTNPGVVGQPLEVSLAYTNYGKIPAIITRAKFSAEVGNEAPKRLRELQWHTLNSVLPNGKVDYLYTRSTTSINNDEMLKNVTAGDGWVALHARIQYHDLSNQNYESDLCMYSGGAGDATWRICDGDVNKMKDCGEQPCSD